MDTDIYDWQAIVEGLNRYLRLRSIPIGMKLFETVEAMEAIPKIRRPKARHTTDQIVAQARQLGWTVGITMADLIGAQCGAVIGLHPQDSEWLSGKRMAGVWFKTIEDASAHQHAMDCVPHGRYRAMAVAPLTSGRLNPPDICLIYGTPGQMIFFINGLQWSGYRKLSFTSVGESACADSWGKALKSGEPALRWMYSPSANHSWWTPREVGPERSTKLIRLGFSGVEMSKSSNPAGWAPATATW